MRWSVVGLIAVGVVAAASAAVLVMAMKTRGRVGPEVAKQPEDIKLLVADKPLKAMAVVDAKSIIEKTVPREQAPEGCITSSVMVLGKVLASPMVQGQAFTPACFAASGSRRELAATLDEGMRAFPISLAKHTGVEGLLYPGCLVDVLASFRVPSTKEGLTEAVSVVLLKRVQVLRVDDETIVSEEKDNGAKGPRSQYGAKVKVLLSVTPQQAEALQLAAMHGSLSVALRNPLHDAEPEEGKATLLTQLSSDLVEKLLRRASQLAASDLTTAHWDPGTQPRVQSPAGEPGVPEPPRAPGPARWEIQVIRGAQTEKESLAYPEQSGKS